MNGELPTEICLEISNWLTVRDLSRLSLGSRALHSKWEPCLLSIPVARQRLMHWGCSQGETWAIEKALIYGQQPTYENMQFALIHTVATGSLVLARFLASTAPFRRLLTRCNPFTRQDYPELPSYESLIREPLFAAVTHMAKSGVTDLLDVFLASQVDINQRIRVGLNVFDWPGRRPYMVNSVWAYVLADWTKTRDYRALSASEGLQYLFHHGAVIPKTLGSPDYTGPPPHSLLKLFRHKWGGFASLVNDEAYSMLKILVRKQAATGGVLSFLVWEKTEFNSDQVTLSMDQRNLMIDRWNLLLDLLLTERNFELVFQEELNNLLFRFLIHVMKQTFALDIASSSTNLNSSSTRNPRNQSTNELYPVTIRKLIEKGADIEWRPTWGEYKGYSVLEAITRLRILNPNLQSCEVHKRQRSFVNTLLRLGAKPVDKHLFNLQSDKNQDAWLNFVQGEAPVEEIRLWNPNSGLLHEDPSTTLAKEIEQALIIR